MAKPKKFTSKDVGVYADSARGYNGMLNKIIRLAVSEGMPEPGEHDIEEYPDEVWDETEEWLNEHLAKDGFYFGTSESGDWGYFVYGEE
jgi:hypothetical protein